MTIGLYFAGCLIAFALGYRVGFARKRDEVLKGISRETIAKYAHEASHEHYNRSQDDKSL